MKTKLPTHDSVQQLTEQFADYFSDKIKSIRDQFCSSILSTYSDDQDISPCSILSSFRPATEKEVTLLLGKSASKSCELDPLPTWLLKNCLNELLPIITYIVNLSFSTSNVPTNLKCTLIVPLIKEALQDPEIYKKCCPVSNLTYLSKLVERIVASRLCEHLAENLLNVSLQSAYKELHSTEMALLKVRNDFTYIY